MVLIFDEAQSLQETKATRNMAGCLDELHFTSLTVHKVSSTLLSGTSGVMGKR
jgi:hypothetical protein